MTEQTKRLPSVAVREPKAKRAAAMEFDQFKATLKDAVAFFDGERKTLVIGEELRVTKNMEKVTHSCRNLAATFDGQRGQAAPMTDWKAIPPCF